MPLTLTVYNKHPALNFIEPDLSQTQKDDVVVITLFHEHLGIDEETGLNYILAYLAAHGDIKQGWADCRSAMRYKNLYTMKSDLPPQYHDISRRIEKTPQFILVYPQEEPSDWTLVFSDKVVLSYKDKVFKTWSIEDYFLDISIQSFNACLEEEWDKGNIAENKEDTRAQNPTLLPLGEFIFRVAYQWAIHHQDAGCMPFAAKNITQSSIRLAKVLSSIDPKKTKASIFNVSHTRSWIMRGYKYKTRLATRTGREGLYLQLTKESLSIMRMRLSPNAMPCPTKWIFEESQSYLNYQSSGYEGIEVLAKEFVEKVGPYENDARFLQVLLDIFKIS